MHTTARPHERSRQEVASYETLHGASHAATRLVELGFDEQDVAISPREFQVMERHPLRRRLRTGLRVGAITGATAAGLVRLVSVAGLGLDRRIDHSSRGHWCTGGALRRGWRWR